MRIFVERGPPAIDLKPIQTISVSAAEAAGASPARRVPRNEGIFPRQPSVHAGLAEARVEAEIVQQTVGQLPCGHDVLLLIRLKDSTLRYAEQARAEVRSRATLELGSGFAFVGSLPDVIWKKHERLHFSPDDH